MSIATLLNQDAYIYAKSGYNKYGRDTSSVTNTQIKCRFQNKTATKMLKSGQIVILLGIVYLKGDVVISTEDRIQIGGVSYKVFSVNGNIDGRGNQRLIKCEVEKWQT